MVKKTETKPVVKIVDTKPKPSKVLLPIKEEPHQALLSSNPFIIGARVKPTPAPAMSKDVADILKDLGI